MRARSQRRAATRPAARPPAAAAEGEAKGEKAGEAEEADGEEEAAEEEEEIKAAAFAFEASVQYWSDYLQAQLHPRSIAPLKPHMHGYSSLSRFPDGACVVRHEEQQGSNGPGLVERVRRSLEEADCVQGFHLMVDADTGFGGAAAELLTQVRDDYSHAPCLALGLGTLARPRPDPDSDAAGAEAEADAAGGNSLGTHSYAPALNDAMALTCFAELATSYVPVYGSQALRAALARPDAGGAQGHYDGVPCAVAPPLLEPRDQLRYHAGAPLATFLDAASLSYRARQPQGSLPSLSTSLRPRGGMHLLGGALALPIPAEPPLEQAQRGWFAPLAPLQRAPTAVRAHAQHVGWLGHSGGARAVAGMLPRMLPCGSNGGGLWVRRKPLALPLAYPQFFCASVGREGAVPGAPSAATSCLFTPALPPLPEPLLRKEGDEVLRVGVAAALQTSSGLSPLVRRVCDDWAAERRAVERAASTEGWAARDELGEMTELLATTRDTYADSLEESEDDDL